LNDPFPPDDPKQDLDPEMTEELQAAFNDAADQSLDEAPELTLSGNPETGRRDGLMRWDEALTLEGQVEAVLFAAPQPLSLTEVAEILQDEEGQPAVAEIERVIHALQKLYRERNGGFRLEHDKGAGYQFRTVPAAAPLMERMFASRQRPLSRAALETLAIIAYRQPVTRADIESIRGVDAGSIIKNLLDRDLIACVGRKEDAGRPMMFGTSAEFLRVFRLSSLNELPPLSAFQPAPELMTEAMQRLDNASDDVDVNEFIDDPEAEKPNVSEGLSVEERLDDAPGFRVREADLSDETDPTPSLRRVGAYYDSEEEDDRDGRQDDSDPEVAFPTRDRLTPRSGADADPGAHHNQRPRDEGTGDEN
jgi:segregation and condensation protein B